jgi:hypothetical protein
VRRLWITVAAVSIGLFAFPGAAFAGVDSAEASGANGPFQTWDSCENNRYWHNVQGYQTWPCFMEDNQKWWYQWTK